MTPRNGAQVWPVLLDKHIIGLSGEQGDLTLSPPSRLMLECQGD